MTDGSADVPFQTAAKGDLASGPIPCLNGFVQRGDIVETCFAKEHGGDGKPYFGVCERAFTSGECDVKYADGSTWLIRAVPDTEIADLRTCASGEDTEARDKLRAMRWLRPLCRLDQLPK